MVLWMTLEKVNAPIGPKIEEFWATTFIMGDAFLVRVNQRY